MTTTLSRVETSPDFFEAIYAESAGDPSRIPWEDGHASPALVNWLNAVAASRLRCGARIVTVGCGLGHDARELMRRGYDVTAFDCSATAISWAKQLDPMNASVYQQVDLFDMPARWRHRFDLVVEINTLQSIVPDRRGEAMRNISELLSPHGRLLVVCRGADEPVPYDAGPPWALTEVELLDYATAAGLGPDGVIASFMDDEDPPVRRMRAEMVRK